MTNWCANKEIHYYKTNRHGVLKKEISARTRNIIMCSLNICEDSISDLIHKPFPSTPTLLFISTLVLVPSPIFHSTLHCDSGKHVGLCRHSTLQCLNSSHFISSVWEVEKLPNPAKKKKPTKTRFESKYYIAN